MSSETATLEHKQVVAKYMAFIIKELIDRANCHDDTKLEDPELPLFDEYTPKLAAVSYGSSEYEQFLKGLKPALDHHYAHNRHHPEHFLNGIKDMDLVDLIEMLCDWKAASLRQHDGNILKSIEKNQDRFEYTKELSRIFENTVELFEKRG